nr:hypothetical protein [Tanacetum cinerariifolium]
MDSIISLGQKNTLAEYMILFGADNRPPMLDKDLYDFWKSRMELYMQNREHERMTLKLVEHGPLIWPTFEKNSVIRTKKYAELPAAEKIEADCDIKATNIILQGLPADIYSLERECKLYDAFDKVSHIKGESLHTYYLRFNQLINDMNIYKMKMEQFQVNTKFLNSPPPEWSFVVPVFSPRDDLIACLNKAMAFLTAVAFCNKFRGDKGKIILVLPIRAMLQVLGEILQVGSQELLNATTAKVKDIWLGNALSLSNQGMQHDLGIPAGQAQTIIPHNPAFQTEDLDTYDSDLHMLTKPQAFYDNTHKQALGYQNPFYLKKAQRMKPTLYDGVVMSNTYVAMHVIDNEETLILEEESRSKMFEKAQDPKVIAKKISHKPIDYEKSNRLTEHFGTRFSPQQEFSAEQAFWFHTLNPTIEPSYTPPVIVEVPSELPKASLVNASLKKIKFYLTQFDSVVKKRTTPSALKEDGELDLACKYATRIQELLVYVQDTCPNAITLSNKKVAVTPMNNVKKVRFAEPLTSSSNIKHVESSNSSDSNTRVLSSTGLKCSTSNYGSNPSDNKKNDKISQSPSKNKKNKVEAQPRKVNKKNRVVKPVCNTFTIVGNSCPLTRFTSTNLVPPKKTISHSDEIQKLEIKIYSKKPKNVKNIGSSKIAKIVESKNANHSEPNHTWGSNAIDIPSSSSLVMTGCLDCTLVSGLWMFETHDRNRSQIMNFVSNFLGTVRFGNDQIRRIMRYGEYQLGNVIILRVYYVEGLGHNLFSVGQFCDADLEVAFQKNTCFIRNLEGVDLLSGSRDTNLYKISLDDMLKSSLICLLSKASKTKSWLWHLQEVAAPRAEVLADSPVSTSIDHDAPSTMWRGRRRLGDVDDCEVVVGGVRWCSRGSGDGDEVVMVVFDGVDDEYGGVVWR